MKKLLPLCIALICSLGLGSCVMVHESRDESVLPQKVRSDINEKFHSKIHHVVINKRAGITVDYEIILNNGTEILLDRGGGWTDIEVPPGNEIPASYLPEAIRSYVSSHYPGKKVEEIQKNKSGFRIVLSDGVRLNFDKEGLPVSS